MPPEKVDCVVYHYPCSDGAGAALSAWLALGTKAIYIPLCYESKFNEEILCDKNVVLLDCAFNRQQLTKIRAIAQKILILDHHSSAQNDLSNEQGCFFHLGNSGAILAWHYFHGLHNSAPQLLQLIEDRDLWSWNNRALSEPLFYALVDKHPEINFKDFAQYLDAKQLFAAIEHGKSLMLANHAWCIQKAQTARKAIFLHASANKKYNIIVLELSSDKLVSELAEYLYERHNVDFIMLWYKLADGRYKISFRTKQDHINLGELAKSLGGGGHHKAAAVVINAEPLSLCVDN